ncbi:MAG TPA: hypothetical protein VIK74_05785, partial [Parasegetibacter sp.]
MVVAGLVFACSGASAFAYSFNEFYQDTTRPSTDSLIYPLKDRRGDFYTFPNFNPFYLKNPSNIQQTVEYDPATRTYYIIEKIGDTYYRKPTYLTFEEYLMLRGKQDEVDYFRQRANILFDLNRRGQRPNLVVRESFFNRIFGNGKVDIRPQGFVDIMAGYQGQNIKNPTLPERARRNGGFDFDMNANINVIGNIGDK